MTQKQLREIKKALLESSIVIKTISQGSTLVSIESALKTVNELIKQQNKRSKK